MDILIYSLERQPFKGNGALRTGSNVPLLCLNFPLLTTSQIAQKFYYLVEQCRTKIQSQVDAGYGWEGFHVKICLKECEENE